ncbi:hypothetical protein M9Y10_036215 [Tritrichomonas musculus]|uniref:Protein kinase domain-containing protein n=1 Tax=Tritrichomonas musculus TaxID=1915356 RepID=A0ABR2GWP9_9EUKA
MANDNLNAELYGQIGTGRSSSIYQATVTYKGRLKKTIQFVAAKSVDIQRKDEVYNFVDITASLNHPFIVKFFHWYQTNHHFWLIVEYCPGGTLLDLLDQDIRLPEPIIRIFAGDLLSALLYLHQNGVIFRDLQPRNIMLDECGNLKLNDFTHAERLDKPFDLGVPDPELIEYMAPELFNEQGVASYASDLWALGCLLYRMAAGTTPFFSQSQDDTVTKIHDFQPPKLPGYSNEFNDLIQKLLNKDCFERIHWEQLISHPFWRDSLQKRRDKTFENFNPSSLPNEPRLQSNRQYLQMEKKISTIALPSAKNNGSPFVVLAKGESIKSLILNSELLQPTNLVFNNNIEAISTPSFSEEIPITANQLMSDDEKVVQEAINVTIATFKSNLRPKKKFPFISFLIAQVKVDKIATTLANSEFFRELLTFSKESKNDSLTSGYLLLYASIVRTAREINVNDLSIESLKPLFEIYEATKQQKSQKSPKVARKALLSIGEVAFRIASLPINVQFPKQTGEVILESLNVEDQPMRHYAIRSISNLLTKSRYDEVFRLEKAENAVIDFNYGDNPLMLDSYAVCLVMIYTKKEMEKKYHDKIEGVIKQLLTTNSSTARTMGIMLATCTNMLSQFQKDLELIINGGSIGELRSKALLTMCIIYQDNLDGFANISQRFYSAVDKNESDETTTAIAKWSAIFSNKIISSVSKSKDYKHFAIILQALSIKKCRNEIWTKSFENKFRSILKDANYDDPNCGYLLSIIETALYNNICDVMIVTDLIKAFNSKRSESRYNALKLVADAVSQPKIPQKLITFIEDKFLPQLTQLLKGDSMIADLAFRIFSQVSNADSQIISRIAEKERLPLIFSRIADNASALLLAYNIVQTGQIMINDLVQAGLIDGIIQSMSKVGNESTVNLLYSILFPVAKLMSEIPDTPQLQEMIKKISPLAQLATKLAELIISIPNAGYCLSLLFHIFTPDSSNPKDEVIYKDCFNALGETINQIYQNNAPYPEKIENVIRMAEWVVNKNAGARTAMKKSSVFVKAIKNAAEKCNDDLKIYYSKILNKLLD